MLTPEQVNCEITHHFSSGVYAKQVTIPAGVVLFQHRHRYDHMSILSSGRAVVRCDDTVTEYVAPSVINIPAGKLHSVIALEDATWFCVHRTDEKDADAVDASLIVEN